MHRDPGCLTGIAIAVALLAAVALPTAAWAQAGNVAPELFGYDRIVVNISDTARACDLPYAATFERYLAGQMAREGVVETREADAELVLNVDAMIWGEGGAYCTYRIEMNFVTTITSADIAEDRPDLRAALDQLGSLRTSLYARSAFSTNMRAKVWPPGIGRNTSEDDHVKAAVDTLVDRFRADRQANPATGAAAARQ